MSSLRFVGLAAVAAIVLGCSGAGPAGDGQNICTRCTKGARVSAGAGSFVAPTPCQLSEMGVSVDAQTARTLGFGAALDLIQRDLESPFHWEAKETSGGAAASGYKPATTIRVRTTIAALEHRVPSLAGCQDSVVATLATTLMTGDGALEVEGQLRASLTHDEPAPWAWGSLDLADARGSLMLYPDGTDGPLAGAVGLGVRFWPDRARGFFGISMSKPAEQGGDVYTFLYQPLEGRWPDDDCEYFQRPMAPDEPGATPAGRSPAQLVMDLQGMLDAGPKNGIWAPTGAQSTVAARLGSPTSVCVESRPGTLAVAYRTQLQVMTSDGRLRVNGDARGRAAFDASNALTNAWVEIYDDAVIPAAEFQAKSGIGVDLGKTSAAFWHTEIVLAGGNSTVVEGKVVVEGVDVDGSVTGVRGAVQPDPVAMFHWP